MAAPVGMVFNIDSRGNPIAQVFADSGVVSSTGASNESNAESPFSGDWQLVVTAVPAGTDATTIAALILSSPVALPLPWKTTRWQVAYGVLGAACTAVSW